MSQRIEPARFFNIDETTIQFPAIGGMRMGLLDIDSNFSAADTVTIGTKVYTFVDPAAPSADGEVNLGADANASLTNLKAAINLSGNGSGEYGAGMTQHPFAVAEGINTTLSILKVTAPTSQSDYSLATDHGQWENPANVAISTMTTWVGMATTTSAHSVFSQTGIDAGIILGIASHNGTQADDTLEFKTVGGQILFIPSTSDAAADDGNVRQFTPGGVLVDGGFGAQVGTAGSEVTVFYHVA